MSKPVLVVSPELAEKAKAAEEAAIQQFVDRVQPLCGLYTIKEVARIVGVSTAHLRKATEKHGFHFLAISERTATERRRNRRVFAEARIERVLSTITPTPTIRPGTLKVTPQLSRAGSEQMRIRQNAFLERVRALSETMSLHETADHVQVSVRFMKNFAYDWEITFAGEEGIDHDSELALQDLGDSYEIPESYDSQFFDRKSSTKQQHASH